MNEQYVVVIGSVADGYTIHGPFPDHDAALEYAEIQLDRGWEIVKLEKPE